MAKRKKQTESLDPSDIMVVVPLPELAHLEVSLLRLLQTFHEAGVNAVYQKILQLKPDQDSESAVQDAVGLYNQLVEEQRRALEGYLSGEAEPDEEENDLSEEERIDTERPLFGADKGFTPPTVH
jgi:hypothetical protein